MKILFAFKECPLPPDRSGARTRAYVLLRSLELAGHRVRLVYFKDPGDPEIPGSIAIPRPAGGLRRRFQEWFAPGVPLFRPNYESLAMRMAIREASREMDLVILGQDQMAIYRDEVTQTPCLLDATDAWTVVMESVMNTMPPGLRQRYLGRHLTRIHSFIRQNYRRFDEVLVVTTRDAAALQAVDPEIRVRVIPLAVDLDMFDGVEESKIPLVVYTGVMGHAPNAEGAVWFAKEVWPQIKQNVPQAQLRIVGRNPRPDVQKLAMEHIKVTGEVASMVPHVGSAWVVVCPIRSGGGIKIKVLQAMAAGKPIVSTREGVTGMPGAADAGVLVTDDSESFADAVVCFLRSKKLRREVGIRLQRYVESHFSWKAVSEMVAETVQPSGLLSGRKS